MTRMRNIKAKRVARDAEKNSSALEKALKELEELRQATLEGRAREAAERAHAAQRLHRVGRRHARRRLEALVAA